MTNEFCPSEFSCDYSFYLLKNQQYLHREKQLTDIMNELVYEC